MTPEERMLARRRPPVAQKLSANITRLNPFLENSGSKSATNTDERRGDQTGAGFSVWYSNMTRTFAQGLQSATGAIAGPSRAHAARHDTASHRRPESMVDATVGTLQKSVKWRVADVSLGWVCSSMICAPRWGRCGPQGISSHGEKWRHRAVRSHCQIRVAVKAHWSGFPSGWHGSRVHSLFLMASQIRAFVFFEWGLDLLAAKLR